MEDLSKDGRFATREALAANSSEILATIGSVLRTFTTDDAVRKLEKRDILCAPVRKTAEALEDPQLKINGMIVELDHPKTGRLRYVGPPVHAYGTPATPNRAAPTVGQNTDEILRELGYSPRQMSELRADGVVA
jgi:formyl-CoA transferase